MWPRDIFKGRAAVMLALLVTVAGCGPSATSHSPERAISHPSQNSVTWTCGAPTTTTSKVKAITGTLYYDQNQNGVHDPGEPGLGGIAVFLSHGPDSPTPGVEKSPATCTDASGHFSLTPPDDYQGYRLEIRTGWFRSQCPALTCDPGGPDNNVQVGPEWIYSPIVTGASVHVFNAGLIPDAGQYVVSIHTPNYSNYPPDLTKAHRTDLAARFTDDESVGCRTTTNGVSCHVGQTIEQTLYISNSGLAPVTGIQAVMELPYGEFHHTLALLRSGTSPGITGLSNISVTPATGPRAKGQTASAANYTSITFSIDGSVPPAGLIAVESVGTLAVGTPGTQIVGRAGITHEADAAADTDSAFCQTPVVPNTCAHVSDTHSFLDLSGDDNDSDRFNVL